MPMIPPIEWPHGCDFAFTIWDDTDHQFVENIKPVYDFLYDLGFRTTKSVWPIAGAEVPQVGGDTCETPEYLEWVLDLQKKGFEIALHNATYHTSIREETIRGIERFKELFGHYPYSCANHTGCDESMYWGTARLSGINRLAYNLMTRFRHKGLFQGHVENSPLFWGDVCKAKIKYVRNFVYPDINTLKACPYMPYHDRSRPYVNYWFASTEGSVGKIFAARLSASNQDRLQRERGACIMYTHLESGFLTGGKLDPDFKSRMEQLSRRRGWFVPAATLLDFLLEKSGGTPISGHQRAQLERRWLSHKVRIGSS
jgi:hypothetical protein